MQIGDKLKRYLEEDYHRICGQSRHTKIPAELPISTILENFVRHYAIKQICGNNQEQCKQRRRSSQTKSEPKTKDYEHMKACIELSKEVADGLRLYFDFTVKDYLLYEQEVEYMGYFLSPEYLNEVRYIPTPSISLDMLRVKNDTVDTPENATDNLDLSAGTSAKAKLRLRSQRKEEDEIILDFGAIKHDDLGGSIENGSENSENSISSSLKILKATFPSNIGISKTTKEILNDAFTWKILPANAAGTPSMIFGANYLARLIGE